ncbi:MaoC family dehydratase [Rhodovulum sp. DZ06]|uniref:MaoC family dehydratase n=1 Tax=Rhodovulum sp. DZ06 TaxID=3425126 RepID=UPI003D34E82D
MLLTEIPPRRLQATADKVAKHAELVQDFNPLHLDETFAAKTPFGGAIVHGSMMMNLLVDALERAGGPGFASGALKLRFAAPAMVGETLTASGAAREGEPGVWDVWVARADGVKAVTGTLTTAA